MAITHEFYGKFGMSLANKEIDFNSDDIRVILVTSAYTFDKDAHQYKDVSITNEVANGNGYTTGGLALTTPSLSYDSASNQTRLIAAAPSVWGAGGTATFNARRAIVFDNTPPANKPLISCVDFGQDFSPINGVLTLNWDALGIGYLQT